MPGRRIYGIPSRQLTGWWHGASDWGAPFVEVPDTWPAALPCPPPTLNEWRVRFPEFNDVSDARVTLAIEDASCWADGSWISNGCQNCTTAIAFLAAHNLALQLAAAATLPEVLPDDGQGGGGGVIAGGQLTSLRFETMGVSFSAPKWQQGAGSVGSGGGVGDTYDLSATPYGQRYLELLKVNRPAVVVV